MPCRGQIIKSKLDVVGGISAREFLHTGLRYQYSAFTQIGVYVGSDLDIRGTESITTFCVDNLVHFGKFNYFSNRSVWYARQGYTLLNNKSGENDETNFNYIDLSLGREFPINNWLGFNADLGLLVQFREKQIEPSTDFPLNLHWYYMPLARFQFYISF
jgi:hypothetical protein